ncbi:MAG: glycerol-3-phosphate 1-O-acyltransferase PlsY [Burkholderiaceae bacterium]|nr:glycerol-3-phosphate 1-O-acyltransferase PlsY [Burkholderiaceae bacterium]
MNTSTIVALIFAGLAYLLGSLSFAVLVSRAMGMADPRSYGSGNPGATNVLRSGNKLAAVLTLFLDAFKGWAAVWLAMVFGPALGLSMPGVALVAVAVFLGHLFPVFFHFKGGKGVATAAGVLLAIQPWLGLATLATWLIVAVFFRYSSLAALVAALFAPFYYWFGDGLAWATDPALLLALTLISALLIWRHRANIGKLMRGEESRIGRKK